MHLIDLPKMQFFIAAEGLNGMTTCNRPNLHAAHMLAPSPDRPLYSGPMAVRPVCLSARCLQRAPLIMMSPSVC